MKVNDILKNCKLTLAKKSGKVTLTLKKYTPEILLVCGGVAAVATVVVACKETLKLEDILDKHIEASQSIDEKYEGITGSKEAKKEKLAVTGETCISIVKLYAPAVGLGLISGGCIVASHNVLQRRYLGMVAAYEALDKAFGNYRQNVIDDQGEEKDREYSTKMIVGDPNDGVKISSDDDYARIGYSGYAKLFDETNSFSWKDSPLDNLTFLQVRQRDANELLHARGYLFLNEVYDLLDLRNQIDGGILKTYAGQVVGWKDDEFHGKRVDFGFEKNLDFMQGREPSVMLDFNVDGNILEELVNKKEIPLI